MAPIAWIGAVGLHVGPPIRSRIPEAADIKHRPWPLQPAELTVFRNDMITPGGLPMPELPEHLLCAACLAVTLGLPEIVARVASQRTAVRPLRAATMKE